MKAVDLDSAPFPAGRHSWQIWSMAYAAFVGLGALGKAQPQSLEALFDPIFVKAWGALFVGGCVVSLVAPWLPDRVAGVLFERIGQRMVCGMAVVYCGAIIWAGAGMRWSTLMAYVGAVAASYDRQRKLSRAIKAARVATDGASASGKD